MPLETATYISTLNSSNPAHTDGLSAADSHMRMTKAALLATFPGADGPLTTAAGNLSPRTDGTALLPAFTFPAEPTLGFYRSAAGVISVAGGRLNASPIGSVHKFLVAPSGLGAGAVGTGHEYLELDGSTWLNTVAPALATHLGQGGTSFTLPDMKTLGRFPRSRTASVAAGTAQADVVGSHGHTAAFTGSALATHTHGVSGSTGGQSASHTHDVANIPSIAGANNNGGGGGGAFAAMSSSTGTRTTSGASVDHTHAFSLTSVATSAGTPAGSVAVAANSAGAENRPVALTFIFAIKT